MKLAPESHGTLGPRIVSLPHWLEDCPNLFVQLIRNPVGIGFPNDEFPDTVFSYVQASVKVSHLGKVLEAHPQENIWRSWQLFSDASCSDSVSYVPLLLDIDNEEQNLEGAYALTRKCLVLLEEMDQYHSPDHLRVVFSGMKGFHVEARPSEPIDNQGFRESLLSELDELGLSQRGCKNCFENGTIDPGHDFVRLTGSLNSWNEGNIVRMRKAIQLTPAEFRESLLDDIVAKAEAA